jgi:hypothetical protein
MVTPDLGVDNLGSHLLAGAITAKTQEGLLGLPLLVDIDAIRLQRIARDYEVHTALGPSSLSDGIT